ncbi:MAG: beta-propeller domain-containing protein [Acidimicrobiales bacterium]
MNDQTKRPVFLRFGFAMVALLLVASSCASEDASPSPDPDRSVPTTVDVDGDGVPDIDPRPRNVSFRSTLHQVDDCDELLAHLRAEGAARVGPYGLNGGYWGGPVPMELFAEEANDGGGFDNASAAGGPVRLDTGEVAAQSTAPDAEGETTFSGTNVQELGIDEPDLVKTDGDRIITLTGNVVHIIDVTGIEAEIRGTLRLDDEAWGQDLLVVDDTLYVIRQGGDFGVVYAEATDTNFDIAPGRYQPTVVIDEVDLTDAAAPTVTASLTTSGQFVSGRLHDGVLRLVTQSQPDQLEFVQPQSESGEDRATEVNQDVINESTLEDWLPSYVLEAGQDSETGLLVACDQVHRPTEFAGFGTTAVITIDPAVGLDGGNGAGVLAPAETVYASSGSLYVAAPSWIDPTLWETDQDLAEELAQKYATSIHRFALVDEGVAYTGSGSVEGRLLNQFSLSEYDGHLRVATTVGDPWGWGDQSQSESVVMSLRLDDDSLTMVGQVGDLGRGEEIRSVRFVGDQAYVVTFRQTDPFYVVDLEDPTDPTVRGELKILGYSGYLHPLSDDLILGVGQDGDADGRLTGAKVTVFDVSDPSNPIDLDNWTLDGASTDIEWDHRAFLWWEDERLAVLPLNSWSTNFVGAVVLEIDGQGGINERGRLQHAPDSTRGQTPCEPIPLQPAAETEAFFIMEEGALIQICDENETGASGYDCWDRFPPAEIEAWGFDDVPDVGDDQFVEICWPVNHAENILRTLVIDDQLWSVSASRLQAHDIDTLTVTDRIDL